MMCQNLNTWPGGKLYFKIFGYEKEDNALKDYDTNIGSPALFETQRTNSNRKIQNYSQANVKSFI